MKELRMREPGEKTLSWENLDAFQCLNGFKREGLWTMGWSDGMRENSFKLKADGVRLDVKKKFFTVKVVRPWHKLSRGAVSAPSLEVFKARLDSDMG